VLEGLNDGYIEGTLPIDSPTVIWRKNAAFDLPNPTYEKALQTLQEIGYLRSLPSQSLKFLPPTAAFFDMQGSVRRESNYHFAQQTADHLFAMEDCYQRKCSHCLILEDDIVLSRRWRKRVRESLKLADPLPVGVLKLFEIDPSIRFNPVFGWEITDVPFIVLSAVIGGSIFFALVTLSLQLNFSISSRKGKWCLIVLWIVLVGYSAGIVGLIGHEAFFPDTLVSLKEMKDEPTHLRLARHPTRGAVANFYKRNDIPTMIMTIQDLIFSAVNVTRITSREREQRTATFKTFFPSIFSSEDTLRIDVIVAKYSEMNRRQVVIAEPNVVQHIGFITTEPGGVPPFAALSSTFEDGPLVEIDKKAWGPR
jgi:hypothetical protein